MHEPTRTSEDIPLLFDGKLISIKGKFEKNPSLPELTSFLKAEGAILTDEVTPSLNLLILGKASTRARKAAEELKSSGAKFAIVDDLRNLWKIKAGDAVKQLLDPLTRQRFLQLYARNWLRNDVPLPITKQKLSGFNLQCSEQQTRVWFLVRDSEFTECNFSGVQFSRFTKDQKHYLSSNCRFTRVHLDRAKNVWVENCRFEDVQGEKIDIEALDNCELVRFDTSGSRFKLRKGLLTDSRLAFGVVVAYEATIQNLVLDAPNDFCLGQVEVRFLAILKSRGDASFYSSRLESVIFDNCKIAELKLNNCNCRLCSFENCRIDFMEIDDQSTFEACIAIDTVVSIAKCNKDILELIPGIDVKCYVPSIHKTPIFCKLVDVVADASIVELQMNVEDRSGNTLNLKAKFHNPYRTWYCYFEEASSPQSNNSQFNFFRKESDRAYEKDAFLTDFFRFAYKGRFAQPVVESLRIKTSECQLEPTALKALFVDALIELLQFLPSD